MHRRFLRSALSMSAAVGLLFLADASPGQAQAQAPAAAPAANMLPATDEARIAEVVTANHILADQGVLDGFGHVSVRSARNPKHYFMARSLAPSLVTKDDIVEYGAPVTDLRGREQYSERFIHGEIYRSHPDVQSVVHAHTAAVLPFTVTTTPLKALIHVAYFLGTEPAPVFEIRNADGDDNRMLVNNIKTGAALAKVLGDRRVVLMRGHGMTVVGGSIREAVFEAIYTKANAEIETVALRMGDPVFLNRFEVTRTERISRQWEEWSLHAETKH